MPWTAHWKTPSAGVWAEAVRPGGEACGKAARQSRSMRGEDRRCKEDDMNVGELRRKLEARTKRRDGSAISAVIWETP